jgi:hypothetical protein
MPHLLRMYEVPIRHDEDFAIVDADNFQSGRFVSVCEIYIGILQVIDTFLIGGN